MRSSYHYRIDYIAPLEKIPIHRRSFPSRAIHSPILILATPQFASKTKHLVY